MDKKHANGIYVCNVAPKNSIRCSAVVGGTCDPIKIGWDANPQLEIGWMEIPN